MENAVDDKASFNITIAQGLAGVSPLDRLICLIAQIEVEKYLQEGNHHNTQGTDDESSHLRTL